MSNQPGMKQLLAALEAMSKEEPQDAKARTRARILRAATQLFQRNGYRRTSIDEVARHAHVAKGTVYVHFENKYELLFHAVIEEKKSVVGPFKELFTQELEPAERLRRYLELSVLSIARAPLSARLMTGDQEMLVLLDEMPPEQRAQMQANQAAWMRLFLSGFGALDRISEAEREQRAKVLLAFMYGAASLTDERMRGGLSLEEFASRMSKVIVEGIGAP